ncbi:archaetidylserine decarboxylase [Planctobacterium marinum]|uniref:Phosphatidylserine decarboxylase proenzyme n=1 Tax=Planctobacterium marinum TaxID=1631968 RepID=A0AA48HNC4_9ALTE|nr:phosphatidylserine decarboxylase proenzyme [Planctobacterium marinum]
MLPDKLKISLQYCLPKHLVSRLVGHLAAAKLGVVTTSLIKVFIKQFKVDMAEARQSDPAAYATFNEFFTRPLKAGIRPICEDENALIFPVDGAISQMGPIEKDQIFQAKGHYYSVKALLGGDEELASTFQDGQFMTIYLSPKDYHRIHMPMDATLESMIYVPGELFSVNPLTAQNVPGLFARNERVVAIFNTAQGKMAMVLVGATIVASIETVWAGTVTPPPGKKVRTWHYSEQNATAMQFKKGDEMGRFKLGSTVVMCFEKDGVDFAQFSEGDVTRLGVQCGTLKSQSSDS